MRIKKLAAVMTAAALAASLAACGSKGNQSDGAKDGASSNGDGADSGVIEIKLPTFMAGENVGVGVFLPGIVRF